MRVQKNQAFQINLKANQAKELRWRVTNRDLLYVTFLGERRVPLNPSRPGQMYVQAFEFMPIRAGNTEIKFELSLPNSDPAAAHTEQILIYE